LQAAVGIRHLPLAFGFIEQSEGGAGGFHCLRHRLFALEIAPGVEQLALDFPHDVFHAFTGFEIGTTGPERLNKHLEPETGPRRYDMDARGGIGRHLLEIPREPPNRRMHRYLRGHAR